MALLLVGLLATACTWTSTRPGVQPEASSAAVPSAGDPGGSLATTPVESAPALTEPLDEGSLPKVVGEGPDIQINDVVGTTPSAAGIMFAPVTERVEECYQREGGFLKVRLAARDGDTQMHVDPSSNVDAGTRACVMRALSLADIDNALATSSTSPSEAPPRIESQLTIRW